MVAAAEVEGVAVDSAPAAVVVDPRWLWRRLSRRIRQSWRMGLRSWRLGQWDADGATAVAGVGAVGGYGYGLGWGPWAYWPYWNYGYYGAWGYPYSAYYPSYGHDPSYSYYPSYSNGPDYSSDPCYPNGPYDCRISGPANYAPAPAPAPPRAPVGPKPAAREQAAPAPMPQNAYLGDGQWHHFGTQPAPGRASTPAPHPSANEPVRVFNVALTQVQ